MRRRNDTKKIFWKKGACSCTFFHILNREFGQLKEQEELASSPLAGGIFQQGYQCGMLWGCALAIGTECYKRHQNTSLAIAHAIMATQTVMESFVDLTKSPDCIDVSKCDLTTKAGFAKLMIKTILGGFYNSPCFNLAEKWTENAINSAKNGLELKVNNSNCNHISCAGEVIRQMGGNDEQIIMVAGFAGGLGLSGNACGALSAAIWMNTLKRVKNQNYKYSIKDPETQNVLYKFHKETNYEIECSKISRIKFNSIDEHTDYINNGGCKKLINLLATN